MIPLLSVAIATRNREKFCIKAIESILAFKDERIEICVADHSDTRDVENFINELNSPYVKYDYTSAPISSIDNFNRALGLCTGEFITLIGDDDTILKSMISAVEWMKKNDVQTLAPKRSQRYFWPESRPQSPTGTLDLFHFSNSFEKIDAKEEISKAARTGLMNFYDFKVAKSYHGLVKRELMDKVKEMTGNYYGALSPDVFSVMTLSFLTKKHYFIDYPLSIMGVCRDSTSAHQIYGEHVGKLENMPHLKNRKDYKWDHRVAEYYCVSNIWAESGIRALEEIKAKEVLNRVNIYPILAMGILMNRKYIFSLSMKESEKLRKRNKIPFLTFWINIAMAGIPLSAKKVYSLLVPPKKDSFKELHDILEIDEAQKICEQNYDVNFFKNRK